MLQPSSPAEFDKQSPRKQNLNHGKHPVCLRKRFRQSTHFVSTLGQGFPAGRKVRITVESKSLATSFSATSPCVAAALDAQRAMTLNQPKIQELLSRLYGEEEETDAQTRAKEKTLSAAGVLDKGTRAALHSNRFLAVAPEVGRLLYLLVRSRRPALTVEFGASMGISAIHIAAALRDNGQGRLITTEMNAAKAPRAALHLEQAGLSDWVELRQGDAFETLRGVERIDLLLLDGWKPLYLPLIKQLEPALAPGCLVIADDTTLLATEVADYLVYVRDPRNGYLSCAIPLDDGLELSIR
jgi:predicted O-methyltransferase YrrM